MVDILIIFVVETICYCLGLLSYYPIFRWKRRREAIIKAKISQIPEGLLK